MNLKNLRKSIDLIDSDILKLLNKRARVILDITKVKGKVNESIYVPDREKEVYKNVAAKNSGPMSDGSLRAIYREIMSGALELERPLRIAYFGPEFVVFNPRQPPVVCWSLRISAES